MAYVGVGDPGFGGTTLSPTAPDDLEAGDVLIAIGMLKRASPGSSTFTAPSGWEEVLNATWDGGPFFSGRLVVFSHVYDGDSLPSLSFTTSSNNGAVAVIVAFRGRDADEPIDGISSIVAGWGGSISLPEHTPSRAGSDAMLVVISSWLNWEPFAQIPPEGYSSVFDPGGAGALLAAAEVEDDFTVGLHYLEDVDDSPIEESVAFDSQQVDHVGFVLTLASRGGLSAQIGQVTEADSALAAASSKVQMIGRPSEVSSVSGMTLNGSSVFLDVAHGRELRDHKNDAWSNVEGWRYAWYDDPDALFDPAGPGVPASVGTFDTNALGEARLEIAGTTLQAGEVGMLLIEHPDYPVVDIREMRQVQIGP